MTTFDLRPELNALVREARAALCELRVPAVPDGFSILVPKSATARAVAPATSAKHGVTTVVAAVASEGLDVVVRRTALENDVDAATWLELTLADAGSPTPVARSRWSELPAGDAVVADAAGATLARWRTIQAGPALWTTRATVPAADWAKRRWLADLAVESATPTGPRDLAQSLDALTVRGRGVVLRWPSSWFLSTDDDAPGGLAGTLERKVGGTTVGLMRVMVGEPGEVQAMLADARGWLASGRTGLDDGDVVRTSVDEGAVIVVALAGPSRRAHAPIWSINRRALDIVLERSGPA